MDFLEVMRILRDTQFAGSICPDHMPAHPDDPERLQAFAFGYGYAKALIQAVNSQVKEQPSFVCRTSLLMVVFQCAASARAEERLLLSAFN